MSTLSIFVDESGDFGEYSNHSPYYVVSMILHDQSFNLSYQLKRLDEDLKNLGFPDHVVHTEPLIRRELDYSNLSPNIRRAILAKLFFFATKCDISYKAFIFEKKDFDDPLRLHGKIAREISQFFRANTDFFYKFDNIILYYDNGQAELNRILNTLLATEFSNYEVRRVLPRDYRLFQLADFICTFTLIEKKIEHGHLSKSETLIFHSKKDLKKDFLKGIHRKEFT